MVSFPKYEIYHSTEEDWLGDIPQHWQLLRTKSIFRLVAEPAPKNNDEELLSVYSDIGVKPRRELEARGNKASTTDGYWLVKKGDIIVNKLLAWMGAIGLSEYDGVTSPAYDILRAYKPINSKFYHYLFRNPICIDKFKKHSKGIMEMRLRLYFDEFGNIKIPYPPIEDQNRIVEFLDRKTAEIDQAIEQKQRLIKLLKEQKAILIDRAVTKGLNLNVPMRDSGVDWIGEIPKHWSIAKIKHIAKFISGGTPKKEKPEFWGGDIPWVSAKEMKQRYIDNTEDKITQKALQKTTLKLLEIETIIVVVRGMILARKIPVALARTPVTINQDMKALLVDKEVCIPEYLLLLLEGVNHHLPILLEEAGHGTKTLPTEGLSNFELPIPPRIEQLEIIESSKKKGIEIDSFIEVASQQILLLENLKQIIIAEAVTGKIKI
jgi:type I restriction enzyme, S subunit